jgi:hypothetical protein
MFLFLMTSVSYAQDTIPTTVIIEEEVDLSKENEDYDDDYHTDDSNSFVINIGSSDSNNSFRIGMVDLGFSSYLSDGQLDLPSELGFLDQRLWRSINVGIHLVNYKVDFNPNSTKNRVGISSGIKWNIVHYSMEQDYNLLRNQPDFVSALDFDVPSLKKNRLKANHLQIPLLLEYNSNSKSSKNSISLAVGYVHQFLLQSNFKYKTDDGEKVKTKGEFNLRKSMGFAEARLGIGPINFYVQYGLADLFQVDAGPELTPINFGINIIPR